MAMKHGLHRFSTGLALLASAGVILCCGWFALMELILQHPGYGWRFAIAAAIVVEALATLGLFEKLTSSALRWPLVAAALATGLLGGWILAENLARPGLAARPHFEGYLLIIGLALVAYGAMTSVAMLTAAPSSASPASPARS
jgi:ABC-type uncharacterized transport system permease subunit